MSSPETGSGRASGKIILFGEHAVVYGIPAIAAGLSRGATAEASFAPEDSFVLDGEELPDSHELRTALSALRANLSCPHVALNVELQIPKGAGLGASAAMAMATARALCALQGRGQESEDPVTERELFDAGQVWEEVFHGTPSGVDVAAAALCGAIRFEKNTDPLPLPLPTSLHLAVAQAGPPASTREMVENVAKLKKRNPSQFERNLEAIRAIVNNGVLLLRAGDLRAIGKLMDLNQMILSSWMLSTSEIENACHLARKAGALGAKLTGSGGGGSVIALAPPSLGPDDNSPTGAILDAWNTAGISCFSAQISAFSNGVPS